MDQAIQKKKCNNDLTTGSILDKVLIFALPLAFTSILQQLFSAADIAIVGKFASQQAMAAIGSDIPVVSLFLEFFIGLSIGSSVLIASSIGGKLTKKISDAVHTTISLSIICGTILAVIGITVTDPIIRMMQVPDEISSYSIQYLKIYFTGMPFIMLYNFEAAIFSSCGNTKIPLISLTTGGIVNVASNLFFVLILGMSVDGVAIATVFANIISSCMMLFFLIHDKGVIKLDFRKLRINKNALLSILKIGIPAAFQSTFFTFSNLCIQSAINELGSDCIAAASVSFNIEMFVFYFINAFSQAFITFVGQNYGAGKYARCREVIRKIFLINGLFTVVVSAAVLLLMRPMIHLFTDDPIVIALTVLRMKIIMLTEPIETAMEGFAGVLRGLGKSLQPSLIMLFGICGIRILWLATGFKFYHSWLSLMLIFPVSWAICVIILSFLYITVRKKLLSDR